MIQRQTTVSVYVSPEELSNEFSSLSADEQAQFFNHLAKITEAWEDRFSYQMLSVLTSHALTEKGRSTMRTVGGYATNY